MCQRVTKQDLSTSKTMCTCENIWVDITCSKGKRVIIGVVYRSPSGSLAQFCEHIERDLAQTMNMGPPLVVLGDFNVDLQKNDAASRLYKNTFENFFLEQVVNEETRITSSSRTLIDHVWVDERHRINRIELHPGLSDHRIGLCNRLEDKARRA